MKTILAITFLITLPLSIIILAAYLISSWANAVMPEDEFYDHQ
jgi:hypothetical protein